MRACGLNGRTEHDGQWTRELHKKQNLIELNSPKEGMG